LGGGGVKSTLVFIYSAAIKKAEAEIIFYHFVQYSWSICPAGWTNVLILLKTKQNNLHSSFYTESILILFAMKLIFS
jgi:hypothetical protein